MLTFEVGVTIDYVVLDDKLAYIVCDRLGIPKLFLLDLLVCLVEQDTMSLELAKNICSSIMSRYSSGMVAHTLRILDKRKRKWLW